MEYFHSLKSTFFIASYSPRICCLRAIITDRFFKMGQEFNLEVTNNVPIPPIQYFTLFINKQTIFL